MLERTTPDRRQNLLFCQGPPVTHEGAFRHDAEVSEVLVIHQPVETAFPLHTERASVLISFISGGVEGGYCLENAHLALPGSTGLTRKSRYSEREE
jgi:hypothetical protein